MITLTKRKIPHYNKNVLNLKGDKYSDIRIERLHSQTERYDSRWHK